MVYALDSRALSEQHKKIHDNCSDDFNVRIRRSLSWMRLAEQDHDSQGDIHFILLWIGFNALYEVYVPAEKMTERKEATIFRNFLKNIIMLDEEKNIHDALWKQPRVKTKALQLVRNKFVCSEFWRSFHERIDSEDWQDEVVTKINSDIEKVHEAISSQNSRIRHLRIIFNRLYTLRNQMIHGSTTVKTVHGGTQRSQGGTVLASLLPVFISIMLAHPNEDWGKLSYPSKDISDFVGSM